MASKRQSGSSTIIRLAPRKRKPIPHDEKLRFLSQYGAISDPTNKKSVDQKYRTFKKFPLYLQRPADKKQREELKQRGFFVTGKGVIIDGPRNAKREPIKGAKFEVLHDGVVKWSYKDRRDYIVGFTAKDKKEFARDPDAFVKKKEAELRAHYPTLARKKFQTRLQWGAYQATKDFHPYYFTKRYPGITERAGKAVRDRLTGLHIVIHNQRVPKHLSGLHITAKVKRK